MNILVQTWNSRRLDPGAVDDPRRTEVHVDKWRATCGVYYHLYNNPGELAFASPELIKKLSPELIGHCSTKILVGLGSASEVERLKCAKALKALKEAGVLPEIDEALFKTGVSQILIGLSADLLQRANNAEALKILKGIGLLLYIDQELLDRSVGVFTTDLNSCREGSEFYKANSVALRTLTEAALISEKNQTLLSTAVTKLLTEMNAVSSHLAKDQAMLLGALKPKLPLSEEDQKLLSTGINIFLKQLGAQNPTTRVHYAYILKTLNEANLLSNINQELLKSGIDAILAGLADQPSISSLNSQALLYLGSAGLLSNLDTTQTLAINEYTRRMISELSTLDSYGHLSLERHNTLVNLIEAGLFSYVDQELVSSIIEEFISCSGVPNFSCTIERIWGLKALIEKGLLSSSEVHLLNGCTKLFFTNLRSKCLDEGVPAAAGLLALKRASLLPDINGELSNLDITHIILSLVSNDVGVPQASANLLRALEELGLGRTLAQTALLVETMISSQGHTSQSIAFVDCDHILGFEEYFALVDQYDQISKELDLKLDLTKNIIQKRLGSNLPLDVLDHVAKFVLSDEAVVTRQTVETKLDDPDFSSKYSTYIAKCVPRCVSSIVFRDEGSASSDFEEHLQEIFRFPAPFQLELNKPRDFPKKRAVEFAAVPKLSRQEVQKLQDATPYGRTLVHKDAEGRCIAFKLLKANEDLSVLQYELEMMQYVKQVRGLEGDYPNGVRLVKIPETNLANRLVGTSGQLRAQNWSILLKKHDGNYYAMVYEADEEYFIYINDPNITKDQFEAAFKVSLKDRTILMANGIIDTEIIELFHNQENGEGRLYDWMVDVKRDHESRRGAGRLDNIPKSTLYPNIRMSGLADFAAMYHVEDVMNDPRFEADHDLRLARLKDLVNRDAQDAIKYVWAAYYGDMLLSLALMPPTYLLRRGELNYEHERDNEETWLKRQLKGLFSGQSGINYSLMAEQMAFFMTARYATEDIPEHFYRGAWTSLSRVGRNDSYDPVRGWDMNREMYQVPVIEGGPISITSFDLGPVNGPNPLTELIKALYYRATTATVMLGRQIRNLSF